MSDSSSASYTKPMTRLATRGISCYAPDIPGFGHSFDQPTDPQFLTWYAELNLNAFTTHPAFEHGYHVGHHSGAPLGVELALLRPSLVPSLTMVGPVVMPSTKREKILASTAAFNEPGLDSSHLLQTWQYL